MKQGKLLLATAVAALMLTGCSKLEGGVSAAKDTSEYKDLEAQMLVVGLEMMGGAFGGEVDKQACEKMIDLQQQVADLFDKYQDTEVDVAQIEEDMGDLAKECGL